MDDDVKRWIQRWRNSRIQLISHKDTVQQVRKKIHQKKGQCDLMDGRGMGWEIIIMILILIILKKNIRTKPRESNWGKRRLWNKTAGIYQQTRVQTKVIGLVQVVRGLYTLCVQAPVLKIPYKNPFHWYLLGFCPTSLHIVSYTTREEIQEGKRWIGRNTRKTIISDRVNTKSTPC